jgi:hypothetical protein
MQKLMDYQRIEEEINGKEEHKEGTRVVMRTK